MYIGLLLSASELHAARVDRAAFSSEHFDYLIDKNKTSDIQYFSDLFESAHATLSQYFEFSPDLKIKVLFLDEDDYANGFAFSAQGWVVIFLPHADFVLRGNTSWLPNVIAHELAHIITLRKMGETSKFLGLQMMFATNYYSNVSLEGHIILNWYNTPAWFAEGLAQHGSQVCFYDTTDTHRTMILQSAADHDKLLSLPEMSTFGWDARRNEMIYTQGYFLINYLYEKYGQKKMNLLLNKLSQMNFEKAFKHSFSLLPSEIYQEWLNQVKSKKSDPVKSPQIINSGQPVTKTPHNIPYFLQASPVMSSNGTLAYLSSEKNDYGVTDLFVKKGSSQQLLKRQISGKLHLSQDRSKLYFSSLRINALTALLTKDLFEYNFLTKKLKRLTRGARIYSAEEDSNGALYVLSEAGGRANFSLLKGDSLIPVGSYPPALNISELHAGVSKGEFMVEIAQGRGTDIYRIDITTGTLTPLLNQKGDERTPFWQPEQKALFFSANYTDNYQIYVQKNDSLFQITTGSGNYFSPYINKDTLYYTSYTHQGFILESLSLGNTPLTYISSADQKINPSKAFPLPTPQTLTPKAWGDDGLKYLGYSGYSQLIYVPPLKDVFMSQDEDSPLYRVDNPGGYLQWTGGIGTIWLHPGGESQLYLQAGVSDEINGGTNEVPYVSNVSALYVNKSFLPEFTGAFQSSTLRLPLSDNHADFFKYTILQLYLGLDFRLGNHINFNTFGTYSGISLNWEDNLLTDFSGGGGFFGGAFSFNLYQPGVNYPNELLLFQSGLGYMPGFGINELGVSWNQLSLAAHSFRKLFYQASLTGETLLNENFNTSLTFSGNLGLDLKIPLKFPTGGGRNIYFTNLLPTLGLDYLIPYEESSVNNSEPIKQRPSFSHFFKFNKNNLQNNLSQRLNDDQLRVTGALNFKLISPLKNLVLWRFYYIHPLRGEDKDFTVGLSLSI